MKLQKASTGGEGAPVTAEALEKINAMTRRALTAEEVYLFSVRLCDNEVDRDWERFSTGTLEALAPMFVGKSGLFDHQWSARGQAARIYQTEVVREPERMTQAGETYAWLKGYAYMLRTEGTRELIAEIEGGIKKEVSVGCAVERAVCSICGEEMQGGSCAHVKGHVYEGRLCYASLEGAKDAYEFSFVAVPAQPEAGVVKTARRGGSLKALAERDAGCRAELETLEKEARLGRQWLGELRGEVVRLGLLAELGLEQKTLRDMAEKLDTRELLELKAAYGRRAAERYPLRPQLDYAPARREKRDEDGEFLI